MRFKVGDKVHFLNESGGGVVKAILDSKLVNIETDQGFEMPVLITDLIKDYRAQPREEDMISLPEPSAQQRIEENEPEEDRVSEISPWRSAKEEAGVYLVFEPHEQQWVLTGELDLFLVNHTNHQMLFSLFMEQDGQLKGIDYDAVPNASKILIETISRDEIENWCQGFIQIMFHDDQPSQVVMPLNATIDIKPSRFFKEGSYQPNTLVQGRALILSIAPESIFQKVTGSEHEQKYGSESKAAIAEPVKEKSIIDKHRKSLGEAVVDLHIGELIDNILGLSSHDMLNIQNAYFTKTLESAIRNDYHKVTFIHGVGNGVLKNAIIKQLEDYEGLDNRMASISKFGVGAVDVLIKSKE